MNSIQINSNLLEVMKQRWIKVQLRTWATADMQFNDLQSKGVRCSYSSVCNWRQGLIPHFETMMAIALAGWRALVVYVQAPAMSIGEIRELEAQIEEREKQNVQDRQYVEALLTFASGSDDG